MRIVLAGMALVGLVSTAIAADLPATQPQARRAPAFTWSGFYAGAHGGYSWSDTDVRVGSNCCTIFPADIGNGVFPTSIRAQQDGPMGGGQVGYNLQIGRLVAGIEADASWMGARSTASHSAADPLLFGAITNSSFQTRLDWLATVRGRAGLTFGRALLFATGGVAFGDVENRITVGMPNPPAFFPPTHTPYAPAPWLKRDTEWGWVAGGGIEYAVTDSISLKGEYLYYDLGKRTVRASDSSIFPASEYVDYAFANNGNIARVGANFRF